MTAPSPSLETISELHRAAPPPLPMMTSWSPRAQPLECHLSSESVTGSLVQFPPCLFHLRQLLLADESYPPQSRGPAWTCSLLSSGSEGSSWHVVLLPGRNTSADCSALHPPVIRMAAAMEIFIFSGNHTHKITKFLEASNPVISCLI